MPDTDTIIANLQASNDRLDKLIAKLDAWIINEQRDIAEMQKKIDEMKARAKSDERLADWRKHVRICDIPDDDQPAQPSGDYHCAICALPRSEHKDGKCASGVTSFKPKELPWDGKPSGDDALTGFDVTYLGTKYRCTTTGGTAQPSGSVCSLCGGTQEECQHRRCYGYVNGHRAPLFKAEAQPSGDYHCAICALPRSEHKDGKCASGVTSFQPKELPWDGKFSGDDAAVDNHAEACTHRLVAKCVAHGRTGKLDREVGVAIDNAMREIAALRAKLAESERSSEQRLKTANEAYNAKWDEIAADRDRLAAQVAELTRERDAHKLDADLRLGTIKATVAERDAAIAALQGSQVMRGDDAVDLKRQLGKALADLAAERERARMANDAAVRQEDAKNAARAEAEAAKAELAATRKAKAENDERFMLERDEARAELAAMKQSHNYLTFGQVKKERDDLKAGLRRLVAALPEIRKQEPDSRCSCGMSMSHHSFKGHSPECAEAIDAEDAAINAVIRAAGVEVSDE